MDFLLCIVAYRKYPKKFQVGDVAVIDISATTIEQDGSDAKTIPAAESKGLLFL